MKVIIVGGVAGGASCAARLRRLDEKAEILLVERGPYVSYANCGLPYHIGGVIEKESSLLVADANTFRNQFAIDVRTGHEATVVSPETKTVDLRKFEYSYLDFGSNTFGFGPVAANVSTQINEFKVGLNYHLPPGTLFGRW